MTPPAMAVDGPRYEALIFDWDGTAVPDRSADASHLRALVADASRLGLDLAVVTGTHVENVDEQLAVRPDGAGELHMLVNRGSEVFRVDPQGLVLIERRTASPQEDAALDAAAALTVERLAQQGLEARVVSQRLNRRKIDLIPEPAWADPPKARIDELLAAVEARLAEHHIQGLVAAVTLAEQAAADAGLAHARVTSDAKHIEIGLTDKTDSARWWFDHLWRRGIAPEQVLVVGDELGPLGGLPGSDSMLLVGVGARAAAVSVGVEPGGVPPGVTLRGGGPAEFARLLERQLALRRVGAMPSVSADARWTLTIDGNDAAHEQARESMLSLVDGRMGTRGSLVAPNGASSPAVLLAGAYRGEGEESALQPAPLWNRLSLRTRDSGPPTRVLDLHAGLLRQTFPGEADVLQFSSLARPGVAVLRALGRRQPLERSSALVVPADAGAEVSLDPERTLMRVELPDGAVEVAATQTVERRGEGALLERIVAYTRTAAQPADEAAGAAPLLASAVAAGREALLIEHRCAWAARWERGDVRIEGDPGLQRAVRLALYHLMGSAADSGEAAIGARSLTGPGYRGHVFWDADVFVVPFLAATHPAAARAALEYRVRRLGASLEAARACGRAGARFAWESAATGFDVTPKVARDRAGHEVEILTGEHEEHIVADVAWACACYVDWSADEEFRRGPGRRLVVETARYWASRLEWDDDGRAHIRGVIGPDEYHEMVDDNAYTNVMARWNLRHAFGETTDADVENAERASWLAAADALVDGLSAGGLYEEFAGFFELEPVVIAELAPRRPIAADLLLGRERVEQGQVVKQADVLMLHHLVPEELAAGSLSANLAYYEPRTAHGSSLSPGVHAALFARDGNMRQALEALALTARIDLDDISDSTAGGVHIAAMASLWQAVVMGFAGVRPRGSELLLDPHLPGSWDVLEFPVIFKGAMLTITITPDETRVRSDRSTRVNFAGRGSTEIGVGETTFATPGAAR
jgi:trehalose/maltose hydrolase-like predicted phosphorylase